MKTPYSQLRASVLCLLLLSFFSTSGGRRVDLVHTDSNHNLSPSQILHRAVQRAQLRVLTLANDPSLAPIKLPDGEYIAEIVLSVPAVTIRGILDTTVADMGISEIIAGPSGYNTGRIPLIFYLSSTMYLSFFEVLSQASGYVGLGRGNHSSISQMGETMFSYCFTPLGSSSDSPLLLGHRENLDLYRIQKSMLQTVKLHQNSDNPSRYYLYMKSVTVGSTNLKIEATESHGNGALVMDSRSSISALDYKLYEPVMEAFRNQVQLPVANSDKVGLDLCFSLPQNRPTLADMNLPRFVFHFEGGDMHLPVENYMGVFEDAGLVCLMMSGFSRESIMGNFQQQNMRVVFDLDREELSFLETRCDCEDFLDGRADSMIDAEHGEEGDAYHLEFNAAEAWYV